MVQLVFQSVMTDPLYRPTSAPPNSLLDLNLNMNLNPKITVHDDMYDVKYSHTDTFMTQHYLNPLSKLVSCAILKVTHFIYSEPYLI